MFPPLADPTQPVPPALFRAAVPAMADVAKYPDATLELYLGLAHENLNEGRLGDMYAMAQCWYAAHFIALVSQAAAAPGKPSGSVGGVISSKSVGGVSISYDVSSITNANAGQWNSTLYGRLLWPYLQMAGTGPLQFN